MRLINKITHSLKNINLNKILSKYTLNLDSFFSNNGARSLFEEFACLDDTSAVMKIKNIKNNNSFYHLKQ